jgi:hemin uptake protein HemP
MTEQPPITSENPPTMASAMPVPQDSRMLRSTDIFAGSREVLIAHGDEYYRLRLTRSNKLILHK